MDDKTIDLQAYKESKRQQSIEKQKQWEEEYKQTVMDIANSSPVPTTRISTSDDEAVDKIVKGKMAGTVITEDRCVCCGRPVPEGRMVCEECEIKTMNMEHKPLPPKTWERKKKSWIERLFSR